MSLSCGAILNLGICRHTGNGQGEVSLLGDVLLAESLLSNWTEMVLVKQRGADTVSRLNKASAAAILLGQTTLTEQIQQAGRPALERRR
jgi:hypothetical protein